MVQILNKMVHLKYPILEIWCCQKHFNKSGSIALHKSFSQSKYSTQFCLFVLANQLRFLATFGTCYSSQMPSSMLKCGKKLRNVPKQVCHHVHSTAQVIVTGKIRRVLHVNFECLFWPIKCMHLKPRFWVHFGHCFAS